MKTLLIALLMVLIPPLAAFLAVEWAQFSAWVQTWPKVVTELFGVVFAFGVGWLVQLFGFQLPGDFATWDQGVIAAVLMAIMRLLLGVASVARAMRFRLGLQH
jgi:hypothetical protein